MLRQCKPRFTQMDENRIRFCPKPQRRGQFDELVVLLFDDLPVDRPGQNCLKIGILLSIGRPV